MKAAFLIILTVLVWGAGRPSHRPETYPGSRSSTAASDSDTIAWKAPSWDIACPRSAGIGPGSRPLRKVDTVLPAAPPGGKPAWEYRGPEDHLERRCFRQIRYAGPGHRGHHRKRACSASSSSGTTVTISGRKNGFEAKFNVRSKRTLSLFSGLTAYRLRAHAGQDSPEPVLPEPSLSRQPACTARGRRPAARRRHGRYTRRESAFPRCLVRKPAL